MAGKFVWEFDGELHPVKVISMAAGVPSLTALVEVTGGPRKGTFELVEPRAVHPANTAYEKADRPGRIFFRAHDDLSLLFTGPVEDGAAMQRRRAKLESRSRRNPYEKVGSRTPNPRVRRKNPLSSLLYPGVHLPEGHSVPWHREAHKRIRAAINRIDIAKTHAAMIKAYNDAHTVVRDLNRKGLGAGVGYPHEWYNDIGSSYTAKYRELGPTEEDERERMMAEARKLEKARKSRKRGR